MKSRPPTIACSAIDQISLCCHAPLISKAPIGNDLGMAGLARLSDIPIRLPGSTSGISIIWIEANLLHSRAAKSARKQNEPNYIQHFLSWTGSGIWAVRG